MADKELVRRTLENLQNEFRKSFPPAGLKAVRADLAAAPDKAVEKAFDYYVLNGRFPSPQNFRDQVLHEAKMIAAAETRERESDWNRTKGAKKEGDVEGIRAAGSIFTREQQDELGRESVKAILQMLKSTVPRQDKLDLFKDLDTKFPGIGWAKEGMLLRQFWLKKGLLG